MEAPRRELAAALPGDLRRIDARIRETRKKLAAAVAAAGTSLTGLSAVGPVIAAAVIGEVRDVSRFGGRDHFAAFNGTAPVEVSSGQRKVYRLSRRGNRRHGHAIHMAAITQIRNKHSQGRPRTTNGCAPGSSLGRRVAPNRHCEQRAETLILCSQLQEGGGGDDGTAGLPDHTGLPGQVDAWLWM